MSRYRPLIRKLVDATIEAESSNKDVAEVLRLRCFNETSLIRQTLMNAVCDPRFKIGADSASTWREDARRGLEQFADLLEKTVQLTDEKAYYALDNFLSEWFRNTLSRLQSYSSKKKKEENLMEFLLQELENSLKVLGEADEKAGGDKDDKKDRILIPSEGENTVLSGSGQGDEEEKKEKDGAKPFGQEKGHNESSMTKKVHLEDMFLNNIPPSLISLARKIGRVGEHGYHQHGQFMRAGKSDIVGVTVGNDMTAILPSELTLLAERKTQDVFYHNYAAKRLQLFASASQSNNGKRHQDGPVIMCVDTSSSMSGNPMMIAKVLAITVAIIAWRRKRDVIIVKYSDDYDYLVLGHHRSQLDKLLKYMRTVLSGGNNENRLFQNLFNEILPTLPDYKTADVLCISDFGWMPLTSDTLVAINDQKQQGMRFYGLNIKSESSSIINAVSGIGCQSPMDVCDSVWTYERGECKEIKTLKK